VKASAILVNALSQHRSLQVEVSRLEDEKARLQQDVEAKKITRDELEKQSKIIDDQIGHITQLAIMADNQFTRKQEKQKQEIHDLEEKRDSTIDDIAVKRTELDAVNKSMAEAEATLKKIELEAFKARTLAVFVAMCESPKAELPKIAVLETFLVLIESVKDYLWEHMGIISDSKDLHHSLFEANRILGSELRRARREAQ